LESIYSLFLHIQQPDHGLDSSFERGLFLKFPSFKTQAIIGRDNIYLDFTPVSGNSAISICSVSSSTTSSPICRKNSDYQNALHSESEYLDSLLLKLKEYYATVKTKHQLNLEVPAGFRKTGQHQQNVINHKHLSHLSDTPKSMDDSSLLLSDGDNTNSSSVETLSQHDYTSDTNLSSSQVYSSIIDR